VSDVEDAKVDAFVRACHEVAARGLLSCSSGNMSQRIDDKHMLITASRSWLGNLSADDIALCRIDDGSVVSGRKPSVEFGIHAGCLMTRPDVDVVLHFQTPAATTLACRPDAVDYFVIPEIPYYIGHIARVPYIMPGTAELAEAVTEALRYHDLVQLSNHGQVTVGKNFGHAIQNASFFELACEIILQGGVAMSAADSAALLSFVLVSPA
jgi:ribulose-5-phosphate 4-epimerase/fuculose-1-phosphate aldolase